MAKATVLRCDLCNAWDSVENPVRSVPIAGPRFELCSPCRVRKITEMGVDPIEAGMYVEIHNQRAIGAGALPSLTAAVKQWRQDHPTTVTPKSDEETEDNEGDELDEKVHLELVAESVGETDTVSAGDAESIVDSVNGDHESVTVSADEEGAAETGSVPTRGRARRK